MTLKRYIKYLQEIEKKHPNVKVICMLDDDTNCHESKVPELGNLWNRDFISKKQFSMFSSAPGHDYKINALCLNW